LFFCNLLLQQIEANLVEQGASAEDIVEHLKQKILHKEMALYDFLFSNHSYELSYQFIKLHANDYAILSMFHQFNFQNIQK